MNDPIITQKINPYILAMTAGMLLDYKCPDATTNLVMAQIIQQAKKVGININEMLTRRDIGLPPMAFSIPMSYLTIIAEHIEKALEKEPGGSAVLAKAWMPFISAALAQAEADDIKINRGVEYGTN